MLAVQALHLGEQPLEGFGVPPLPAARRRPRIVRLGQRGLGQHLTDGGEPRFAQRLGATVTLDRPLQIAPEAGSIQTVAQMAGHVREMSARLWAAGVRTGDRVAIHKTDNFDIALLACATARIGAVPVLLSAELDTTNLAILLRRLDRPWLVTDSAKLDTIPAPLPPTRGVLLCAGDERPDTVPLRRYDGAAVPEPVRPPEDSPGFITHTSGTTDVPKLVVQNYRALWYRFAPQKVIAWPIRRRETFALAMSFVHARFYSALGLALAYGNPLVIAVDARPENIGPLFARTRPGYVETQPNTFVAWEDLADAEGGPLSNVRYYFATFDAMHPRTIARLLNASKRRSPRFIQVYGQTETGPVTGRWYSRRRVGRGDGRNVGWPLPGLVRFRVVTEDGRRARRGELGYLEVNHHGRAATYLAEEDRFRRQLTDGKWWRMGDVGYRDRLGRIHLLDREIDRIDSVGSNLEVEDALLSRLPELREVVVVAGPDGKAVPVVATRGEVPLDLDRWRQATSDLPALEPPVQIRFDELPRTATWKIRRPELGRLLQEQRHG
mgnify:CR=1 FL=1